MKELRLHAKLKQKDVADALHISRSLVSKWEAGVARPDISMLIPLARLYYVSLERLVEILTNT